MPAVPKKPMIFMFSSTFPSIAMSADSPRLRFNHIRDLCSQKMCFFPSKNHTLANLREYQKTKVPVVHVRVLILPFSLHWPRIEFHDFRRTHYDDFSVSRHRPKKVSGLSSLFLMAPKNIRGTPERPYKLSRPSLFCPMDRFCHFVIDVQYPNRFCNTGIDFVGLQS